MALSHLSTHFHLPKNAIRYTVCLELELSTVKPQVIASNNHHINLRIINLQQNLQGTIQSEVIRTFRSSRCTH